MSLAKKSTLVLPKLKTRDELLKAAPQLARFLAEDADAAASRTQLAYKSGRPRSPGAKTSSGSRGGATAVFGFDEVTEEEYLRGELERVKADRVNLLESLAKLHMDQGKSGGFLQQDDIRLLRREIEAKKEKLNDLRGATKQGMETLEKLETTSRDCEQLMPQGLEPLHACVQQLTGELMAVEADIVEAEAKNELYKLLEIRTRVDHQQAEHAMREARELRDDAVDDVNTLTNSLHEMRAAKEDAEQQLGMTVAMSNQVRSDWHAKLKDRRKEVRELERRKLEDAKRQEQQAAVRAEKERSSQDKTTHHQREQEAHEARLSAVVPQLEAVEAMWARLHALTGGSTCDDAIAYWQELKDKEANMRELVSLAEVREARAKEEIAGLLGLRAEVFDSTGESARVTAAGNTAESTGIPVEAEGSGAVISGKAQQIAEAKRRKQMAKMKFNKLRQVCVAAEQGLHLLSERLKAAMSRSAAPSADGGPPADRRRTSVTGSRRPSSMRRHGSVLIRRMSAVGFKERRQSQQHTVLLDAGAAADIAIHIPAGSSINDKDFFPELLTLVGDVSSHLDRMLAVAEQMERADAMQKDAAAASDNQPSEMLDCETPGSAGSKRLHWADRLSTPRVDQIDGQLAVLDAQAAQEAAGEESDENQEKEQGHTVPQAADGEKQLRRGFRRRTWAGPAWVDAVSGKGTATPLLDRKAAAATSGQQLHRIAGFVNEPDSEPEQDGFAFDSSENSDDDHVVDRHYLKHRAHKLTAQKGSKARAGTSSNKPGA